MTNRSWTRRQFLAASTAALGVSGITRPAAADGGFEIDMAFDRLNHGLGHQSGAGIVQVDPLRASRRLGAPTGHALINTFARSRGVSCHVDR